ncbi:hypothetical protein [Brevibacillus brevis]|uniref:hypothetical protein n=1 Tax=Brevibacillus brevis TaxID=1393 RepID=UPI0025A4F389|nr:hypothetical protein [Brevibacillus brevis]WJQ84181.1 hypothetical protein QN310_13985 [Brevibacillus brevis]
MQNTNDCLIIVKRRQTTANSHSGGITLTEQSNQEIENKELKVLGTHAAGSVDLFETRKASKDEVVEAPKHPGGAGSSGTY